MPAMLLVTVLTKNFVDRYPYYCVNELQIKFFLPENKQKGFNTVRGRERSVLFEDSTKCQTVSDYF
jgi:hypothetical protein